jgi:hypothetical protein
VEASLAIASLLVHRDGGMSVSVLFDQVCRL